jgi:hypothetical protein
LPLSFPGVPGSRFLSLQPRHDVNITGLAHALHGYTSAREKLELARELQSLPAARTRKVHDLTLVEVLSLLDEAEALLVGKLPQPKAAE